MAGLLLKYNPEPPCEGADSSLVLVDLAPYFVQEHLRKDAVELAWSHSREGRQWFQSVQPRRWLFVEGDPDRFPEPGETVGDWLRDRWGSFRGLEVQWSSEGGPVRITAFVDPWGSRPLYYFADGRVLIIADKVANIAANLKNAEVEWDVVVEAMLLGSAYSGEVSLKHTTALRPGEEARFLDAQYRNSSRHTIPTDPEIDVGLVRSDPAGALRKALQKSVADIWKDKNARILLTGGLDSRFLLALADPPRRSVHVNLYPGEAKLAAQIAEAAGCEFQEYPLFEGHYVRVLEQAYLLTGAMFDSRFAWQLSLGRAWNQDGISATLNGYLFDTLMKGYFFVPYESFPYRDSILFSLLGPLAHSMHERMGRFSSRAADMVFRLLSPDAQEVGKKRLRQLPEMYSQVVVDKIDMSFEKLVLANISRQVHYPLLLGWLEETEAYTPAFHPALWSWYAASSTADRHHGHALRQALASVDHAICRVPDANTGGAIGERPPLTRLEKLGVQNNFAVLLLRNARRRLMSRDAESKRTVVGRDIRLPEGLRFIHEWIERSREHSMFNSSELLSAWQEFQAGDDRAGEALLVVIGARQWEQMVSVGSPTTQELC